MINDKTGADNNDAFVGLSNEGIIVYRFCLRKPLLILLLTERNNFNVFYSMINLCLLVPSALVILR